MKKFWYVALACLGMLVITGCGQIDANEAGFKTWFGKIDTPVLEPGLYGVSPIGGSLYTYSLSDIRSDIRMQAYTKDMQQAEFIVSVTHAVDKSKLIDLHVKYGKAYANIILGPVVSTAVKEVVGGWEADKLINGREKATKEIVDKINALAADKPLLIKNVAILEIEYSDVFEKAIEAKQVAMQAALEAKNKTVQVEEEARQTLIKAKAEADALEIKTKALEKNKDVILLNAVEKWNGKLPETVVLGKDGPSVMLPTVAK